MTKYSAIDFAFLAHYVETWNLFFDHHPELHSDLVKREQFAHGWRHASAVTKSVYYLAGRKDFNIVDRYDFAGLTGETRLIRAAGWSFIIGYRGMRFFTPRLRKKILRSVLAAQEDGVGVLGLGALVKDQRLTQGGQYIVDQLGDKLSMPIVHGDTLTAAATVGKIKQLVDTHSIDSPVFLTGSTSKIGRAVALVLAKNGYTVKLFTHSEERFNDIRKEAGKHGRNLIHSTSLSYGSDCRVWVTGKAKPMGAELLSAIPDNAFVVNFSVPNPLKEGKTYYERGISMVEGGLLAYNTDNTSLLYTMRLEPGYTYACHAGTIVHAWKEWQHHEVGAVQLSHLLSTWQAATELGFNLMPLPPAEEPALVPQPLPVAPKQLRLANSTVSLL